MLLSKYKHNELFWIQERETERERERERESVCVFIGLDLNLWYIHTRAHTHTPSNTLPILFCMREITAHSRDLQNEVVVEYISRNISLFLSDTTDTTLCTHLHAHTFYTPHVDLSALRIWVNRSSAHTALHWLQHTLTRVPSLSPSHMHSSTAHIKFTHTFCE
jgi:hypothetical protein